MTVVNTTHIYSKDITVWCVYVHVTPNTHYYTQHSEDTTGVRTDVHTCMCKDYNHLLVRDDFLRVSSLEGLHCQLWCTYQRSQQSLCSLELVV